MPAWKHWRVMVKPMVNSARGSTPLSADQTLWLLACAAAVIAPHAWHAPPWLISACAATLAWRGLLWRYRRALPSRWLLAALTLAIGTGVYLEFRSLFGKDPGTALLLLFLGLKLMEAHTRRDGLTVIFLGYFLQLALFFYAQTPVTAAISLVTLIGLTAGLIKLAHGASSAPTALRLAGLMLAQATPFMLALFVLFPRVQGPLWSLPADAYGGVSGLSENMEPGSIAHLSLSDGIAFRAEFTGTPPRHSQLYWRGPVLTRFDGRTWHVMPTASRESLPYAVSGAPIRYALTLEPHNKTWLFALDFPGVLPPGSTLSSDFRLLSKAPVHARLRYETRSYPDTFVGQNDTQASLKLALQLPSGVNPRARALAQQWRAETQNDEDIVKRMLDLYRRQVFRYTLQPPLLGENSVDEFLFETRRGFCEHFASSFVFTMRATGIPARVVTGYQGGELNPVGGYLVVRQADAHAWAEVWLPGQGWRRVDPTAVSAPSRIDTGLASAIPSGEPLPLLMRADLGWLRDLRFRWDAVANAWNQWVLGYNTERQQEVLRHFGMRAPDWPQMTAALAALTGILMLGLAAWMLRRHVRRDPVQCAWSRLSQRLARFGLARHAWEGPNAYAERIARARPDLAQDIALIARLYVALRYGSAHNPPDGRAARQLMTKIKALKT